MLQSQHLLIPAYAMVNLMKSLSVKSFGIVNDRIVNDRIVNDRISRALYPTGFDSSSAGPPKSTRCCIVAVTAKNACCSCIVLFLLATFQSVRGPRLHSCSPGRLVC